jgi:hypothetical protein
MMRLCGTALNPHDAEHCGTCGFAFDTGVAFRRGDELEKLRDETEMTRNSIDDRYPFRRSDRLPSVYGNADFQQVCRG